MKVKFRIIEPWEEVFRTRHDRPFETDVEMIGERAAQYFEDTLVYDWPFYR